MSTDEAATDHRLEGFEPDNLLAFLALLGLLRTLEAERPDWRPRVRWSIDEPPVRPVLVLRDAATQGEVAETADHGVCRHGASHQFGEHEGLNFSPGTGRELLLAARDGGNVSLLAALFTDAATKDKGQKIEATPYCLLFGQGHQHFLERLAAVPNTKGQVTRGNRKTKRTLTGAEEIDEALFATWHRRDPTDSFRWDHAEDVRHALRMHDPSQGSTKQGTQHGANRLAAVGLACLPLVPFRYRGDIRAAARGTVRDGDLWVRWPIWRVPLSLTAVTALLDGWPRGDLTVMQAKRLSQGKFMNWTVARPRKAAPS